MNMEWLKTIVPMLATALGGPLAGAAAAVIAEKLGVPAETVKDVLASGKMTAEQIGQIKVAEIEFQKFLEANKIDIARISSADRADARDMQKVTRSNMPAVLTVLITFGFFGVLGWMLYDDTVMNSPPLLIMLGSLGTAWTGSCAFWFGTTQGSQNKDQMLAQSAPAR